MLNLNAMMMVKMMIKCDSSSNLDWFKYDSESETLEVCFKNGGVYHYYKVGQRDYDGLLAAKSRGTHFSKNIKEAFKFKKQEKEEKKDSGDGKKE